MKNNYLIEINNLTKSYTSTNNEKIVIIKNLSLKIKKNCNISIMGPSGSGKSTLLNILGLLDSDYSGEFLFNSKNIKQINKKEINKMRCLSIGFVHQFFHLIPELSVIENVALPCLIKESGKDCFKKAKLLLEEFELISRMNFKPVKLSGGEQQRVAIARSLINNPDLILADEMTGNLDEYTAKEIFDFFLNFIKSSNKSLIFVTHNKNFSRQAEENYIISNKMLKK